jgi:hypothetical protein
MLSVRVLVHAPGPQLGCIGHVSPPTTCPLYRKLLSEDSKVSRHRPPTAGFPTVPPAVPLFHSIPSGRPQLPPSIEILLVAGQRPVRRCFLLYLNPNKRQGQQPFSRLLYGRRRRPFIMPAMAHGRTCNVHFFFSFEITAVTSSRMPF